MDAINSVWKSLNSISWTWTTWSWSTESWITN
jgi:hypothetical protein